MSDKSSAYASAELGSELRGDEPGRDIRHYAGLIDDKRILKLLNYYDSLLAKPIEETKIGKMIISNAATGTIDEAVRNGNVSQMKAATGLTGQTSDGKDLYAEAAGRLENEGAIGLVLGSPGSGKTALTIDIARAWQARTGGQIIGNTGWSGFDSQFSSDTEMLESMGSYQGPSLAIIDEVAQELSGYGTGSKAAEAFSDSLLFIRKREDSHGQYAKRGSVLLVGHTRTKTAKSIRRVSSFGIEKPSRASPDRARLLESEGGKDVWDELATYQGLTDTSADYAEYEASEFDVNEEYDSDDSDDSDDRDIARNEQIKTAIRAVESGSTYLEASELVDFSKSWVANRYKEWNNQNKHTALVSKGDE
jgi:hypothetical protein